MPPRVFKSWPVLIKGEEVKRSRFKSKLEKEWKLRELQMESEGCRWKTRRKPDRKWRRDRKIIKRRLKSENRKTETRQKDTSHQSVTHSLFENRVFVFCVCAASDVIASFPRWHYLWKNVCRNFVHTLTSSWFIQPRSCRASKRRDKLCGI